MPESKAQKPKTFRSLKASLTLYFLVLCLATLLITSSLQIYFNFKAEQKLIAGQLQLIAQNAANTVGSFIQEKVSILEMAAKTGRQTDFAEQKSVMEKLVAEPAFRQLVLMDSQKQELKKVSLLSRFEFGCLTEEIKEQVFSQVSQKKPYITSIYIDKITSEPMVVIGVPALSTFGEFQGALLVEVNLKFMWDLVEQIKVGEEGLAYVVDNKGNLIAFSDISRVLRGENLIHLKEVNEFIQGDKDLSDQGKIEILKGIQNAYVLSTHVPLGTPDWAVLVELPTMEAYETVIYGAGLSLIVLVLCSFLAVSAALFLSRRITRPIEELTKASQAIAGGNLALRAKAVSRNEIGQLATAFNEMAERLSVYTAELENRVKERTEELEEAKASLEVRVKARTRELRELSESLEKQVQGRTASLREKVSELERFNKLIVGRELKMIELKEKIRKLEKGLGKLGPGKQK